MIIHREPCTIFLSYAHEDERWLRKLESHLSLLQRQGLISLWHDRRITPGTNWATTIDTHLETASVILLLVSADFLASDYCYGVEMKRALERQETGEAQVIPILLRSVDWKAAPFSHLQALPTDAKPITTWSDEDAALTDVATGIRRVIENLPLLAASAPSAALPTIWNIPYQRNPYFTGREAVLGRIHEHFVQAKTATLTQPVAITGLGGIGKTQIAIEYAYHYAQEYQTVFWLHASSYEVLASDFAAIPTVLNLPEKSVVDQVKRIEAVKEWLTRMTHWLIIFDDANELEIIHDFLPQKCFGHIIITTRSSATGKLAQAIKVKEMQLEDGTSFLLRRSKAIEIEMHGTEVAEEKFTYAKQIVELLGCLPLALEQAGAYIEETACGLEGYITAYKTQGTLLRQKPNLLEKEYPHTVATTWQVSFEKVRQANPTAGELLSLFAFLAPDAIPEELVTQAALQLGPVLSTLANNPLALDDAMARLRRYSLVQRHENANTCSIHSLVQDVIRDGMDEEEQRVWAKRATKALEQIFPFIYHGNATLRERNLKCHQYLPQALKCIELIKQWNMIEFAFFPYIVASYLSYQAQFAQAEQVSRLTLTLLEAFSWKETDYIIGYSFAQIAYMCECQGKYEEAEHMYKELLNLINFLKGKKFEDSGMQFELALDYLSGLGRIYYKQGRLEEAKALFRKVVLEAGEIARSAHLEGEDKFIDAIIRYVKQYPYPTNDLASIYEYEGNSELAEHVYREGIKLSGIALDEGHPYLETCYSNLARICINKGENYYAEADLLLQHALSIAKVNHPDHPQVAALLKNLGDLYCKQDRFVESEQMYRQSLEIHQKVFGYNHQEVAESLRGLAQLYLVQERFREALPLLDEVVALMQNTPGKQSIDMARSLCELGECYHLWALKGPSAGPADTLRHYEEAEKQYTRSLEMLKALGEPEHPLVKEIQDYMMKLYLDRSSYSEELKE